MLQSTRGRVRESIFGIKEVTKMSVQVGKAAPDFTAGAYHGDSAKRVKLSDYRGKWVMLCFYPNDFTYV